MRRSVRHEHTPAAILVGLCRLLGDPDPVVVERAALALAEHSRLGAKASIVHHAIFLRMARAATETGVGLAARKALDEVQRKIARSEALPAGPTVTTPSAPPSPKKKRAKTSASGPAPRKPARLLLRGGVLARRGGVYLLSKAWGYDEDDVRILFGVPEDGRLALREITEPLDVCAVIATQGRWSGRADAVALDLDGEALLMKDGVVSREQVAGPRRRGAPFIGHMTRIVQRADALYALGYGGQAHVRELERAWRPLHEARPSSPGYRIAFYDVATKGSEHLLVGTHVSEFRASDELRTAKAEGNWRAYAEAMRAASRPNRAAVWRLSSAWEEVRVDGEARSVFAVTSDGGTHHLWLDTSEVLATNDLRELRSVPVLRGVDVQSLEETSEAALVVSGGRLLVFAGGRLHAHEPSMPPLRSPFVSISAAGEKLLVLAEREVWLFEGGAWRVLSLVA